MRQAMFDPNTPGPDDFTAGIRDLVLEHAPSTFFGSLMDILAPRVGLSINDITTMVVSLGEAERCQ